MNGIRYTPLINGVEPSWADLVVNIAGNPVVGITKIDYSDDQVKENIYGAGQTPVSRGYGNITSSGSITLLRSEVEAIRDAAPNGRLGDIAPFDIVVNHIPLNGGRIITHRLLSCEFTKDANSLSQGDVKNETEFPLIIGEIKWK